MELFEPAPNRRLIAGQLIWFLAWAGVTFFAIILTPSEVGHGTHQKLGLPPCPSVMLFDRPCPGCGLTTSWTAFVHGNLPLSFRAHALGPFLYLGFTIGAWVSFYAWLKNQRVSLSPKWANWATTGLVTIFLTFGLVRMAITPGFATPAEKWLSKLQMSQ